MRLKWSTWLLVVLLQPTMGFGQLSNSWHQQDPGLSYWKAYAHPINTPFSIEARTGVSVYTGELSTPGDGKLQNGYKNFSWGVGVDYRLTHYLKVAFKIKRFKLASESEPEFWNNRSFSTKNMQYSFSIEHNIFAHGQLEDLDRRINAYVSLGAGINQFRAIVNDPPQEPARSIKESTVVIPMGIGVAYFINQTTHVAFEGHYYATSTDNLDGTFLATGSSGQNDGYLLFEIKYIWQIANGFVYKNHLKRKGM